MKRAAKKLGIIGYGHIGTQLGILAESLGMRLFYDIENKLPLGNTRTVQHLSDLLNMSDVVSLHVPENASTKKNMMGPEELALMKPGALLINASRGTVVDIPALCDALSRKHLAGAAIDVFPTEPATNSDPFNSPLCEFDNVILTPHIGGSTQEAQENIGLEVAGKLAKYSDNGSTLSAVNFRRFLCRCTADAVCCIFMKTAGHPDGANQIFAAQNINIAAQYLQTTPQMGYVVIDIEADGDVAQQALLAMKAIRAPSAPVCCTNLLLPHGQVAYLPVFFFLYAFRAQFSNPHHFLPAPGFTWRNHRRQRYIPLFARQRIHLLAVVGVAYRLQAIPPPVL